MNIVLVVFDSLRKDCIHCYSDPPWWEIKTPNLDSLAGESLVMDRAYPESLPTLPTRRALYTGRRVYPFWSSDFRLKGDFVGAPGWGPIPEEQATLSEMLSEAGYRTALVADVYHMFKPSKNYTRGFNQWMFLRGQEIDPSRSGPVPTQEEIEHWLPEELRMPRKIDFIKKCLLNMRDRVREEDYFAPRVFIEAARWLEQNRDAEQFFLVVESFDPHEPWFVPEHYRRMYDPSDGREQVVSGYADTSKLPEDIVRRTRANYSGLVTCCDRWFGHLYETLKSHGRLEDTLLIVTSDHGHSIGDRNFKGKRGYPSAPEVFDIPIFVRHPEGIGAGRRSDLIVQHHDISAMILDFAGVQPSEPIDGVNFWQNALDGKPETRDHATVAWGSAVTVIDRKWWFNSKVNGRGVFLYDLGAADPFARNVAAEHPEVVNDLYRKAMEDAGNSLPDFLVQLAEKGGDAPGCSDLVARP